MIIIKSLLFFKYGKARGIFFCVAITPRKGIRIPESGKFFASGTRIAFWAWESRIHLKEFGI